ncbi:MAG: hypothetical protein MI717_00810 [Spirochaetales bacterium]|nr:hypothetical protein [Spirochaetales bacterium]
MRLALLTLVFLVLISCDFPDAPTLQNPGSLGGSIEKNEVLFEGIDGSHEILFFTNKSHHALPYGKSFWIPLEEPQNPLIRWTLQAVKLSGELQAGFGMIFCHQPESEIMFLFLIRVDGFYQIAEFSQGNYHPFFDWVFDPAIRSGYGQKNTLEVRGNGSGLYSFLVNGTVIRTYQDENPPILLGGDQGMIVITSPREQFPQIPVDIRFQYGVGL